MLKTTHKMQTKVLWANNSDISAKFVSIFHGNSNVANLANWGRSNCQNWPCLSVAMSQCIFWEYIEINNSGILRRDINLALWCRILFCCHITVGVVHRNSWFSEVWTLLTETIVISPTKVGFFPLCTQWTVNNVTLKDPWKDMRGIYSFCGGISPGKTSQISIYRFWGVFSCDIIDGPYYNKIILHCSN